ncbi:class I SAM-dependent methyltransferase [Roseomonas sp. AR75]|uniref:class I SAM-dependent methyltransferase n=1 Tax=Roseomonas sp. AR75 TaxID=2562311 RepID=UPI0010BFDE2B|nr:class I SAM-dependent methyltransferase [Roseomonas sp. AR75]
MLTDDEIRTAWRLILGREPENDRIYELHRSHESIEALRQILLQSPEFRQKFAMTTKVVGALRLALNPISSSTAEPDAMRRMFERIQAEWTKLGEAEPYWSVLTNPRFKAGAFEENKEDFFRTGERNLDLVRAALARNRLELVENGTCTELGCGVGRVSVQLAGLFAHVHGYDISPGNLALAEYHAKEFGIKNASFHLLKDITGYNGIQPFDFFFSVIVLQHNPPPVQRVVLEKIVEKANPGAILFFQVPTYSARYRFDPETYLASAPAEIEMHVLPQADVFEILTAGGCRVLEVMEDTATGQPDWISNTFLAQKVGENGTVGKVRN